MMYESLFEELSDLIKRPTDKARQRGLEDFFLGVVVEVWEEINYILLKNLLHHICPIAPFWQAELHYNFVFPFVQFIFFHPERQIFRINKKVPLRPARTELWH